jgi:hypothetical protein
MASMWQSKRGLPCDFVGHPTSLDKLSSLQSSTTPIINHSQHLPQRYNFPVLTCIALTKNIIPQACAQTLTHVRYPFTLIHKLQETDPRNNNSMANTLNDATADGGEDIAATANTENQAERTTDAITMDNMPAWTTSDPYPENLVEALVLHFDLHGETRDPSYIRSMTLLIENAPADLAFGPYTSDKGVQSFFDFDTELNELNAMFVKRELKV